MNGVRALRVARRLALLVLGFMLCGSAWAQLTYGVRGGIGFPSLRRTFVDRTPRTANIVGFHAGANIAYFFPSTPGIYLEGGAQLALIGGAQLGADWGWPSTTLYSERLNIYELQLPLRLGYAVPINKLSLYVSAGFLPSVGLWGQIKQYTSRGSEPAPLDFQHDYRRFNIGITFHTGIGFGRLPLFLGVYVDYGLLGIVRATGEGHVGSFGLTLMYLFRRPAVLSLEVPAAVRVKRADDPQ